MRIHSPLTDIPQMAWVETAFTLDAPWESTGYPDAGIVDNHGERLWKTVVLKGEIYALGGAGQGSKELELSVDAPPPAEQWAGISGAPIFVGDRLAGMLKEVPKSFEGKRLAGVPAQALLQNHAFRLALSPPWLDPLPEGVWVLIVMSETKKQTSELTKWAETSLKKDAAAIKLALQTQAVPKVLEVCVTEALESSGKWLRFVNALCAAPIAIFDATEFEPAVMLALGVRAVIRRGVTLTSTSDLLTATELSRLPFNIQETKLMYHGSKYEPANLKHPMNMISKAIKKGWQELHSQPSYLDLPAYDAVRCPYPTADATGDSAVKRALMLCSFNKDYEPNWIFLANEIVGHYGGTETVRMLDVHSPRLVGQALYEGIRWAQTCVVDWTGWRANVFFEFGVRLACADVGPVGVIECGEADAVAAHDALAQRQQLMALFNPTVYRTADDDNVTSIKSALQAHDEILAQRPLALAVTQLPHDATFRACQDRFEWQHEHITIEPHDLLRSSIEAPFGKDPQAPGFKPLLFSANPDYSKEYDRSMKDRWIAAWCYLVHRYPESRWEKDADFRAMLQKLGNDVLQFGLKEPLNDDHLKELRDQIYDVIDKLDEFDNRDVERNARESGHADAN
jgi:hypothetical protein